MEASNLAISRFWRHIGRNAKLDPIISEFETEGNAAACDKWFRQQVEAGLAGSNNYSVVHEE
ncbi:MAG: hypothetical protein ACOYLK_15145, partial [Sphingomonas sp.]